MRLKYLRMAPEIVPGDKMVRGIWHSHERIRPQHHGRREELFSPVIYYEFVAVLNDRRFKMIVKQSPGQERMVSSLIPFWRKQKRADACPMTGISRKNGDGKNHRGFPAVSDCTRLPVSFNRWRTIAPTSAFP